MRPFPTAMTVGIIPARAGFTEMAETTESAEADHPRSRGVYGEPVPAAEPAPGSSPLARGLHERRGIMSDTTGIIPARAGFTPHSYFAVTRARDHPRSRGVYPSSGSGRRSAPGSSPLARGLLRAWFRRAGAAGIIPARAGFTGGCRPPGSRRRDHPRSRGVYFDEEDLNRALRGSSPLARGLHSTCMREMQG